MTIECVIIADRSHKLNKNQIIQIYFSVRDQTASLNRLDDDDEYLVMIEESGKSQLFCI